MLKAHGFKRFCAEFKKCGHEDFFCYTYWLSGQDVNATFFIVTWLNSAVNKTSEAVLHLPIVVVRDWGLIKTSNQFTVLFSCVGKTVPFLVRRYNAEENRNV